MDESVLDSTFSKAEFSSSTCRVWALATIIPQLVTMGHTKLHTTDWFITKSKTQTYPVVIVVATVVAVLVTGVVFVVVLVVMVVVVAEKDSAVNPFVPATVFFLLMEVL